MTGQFLYFSDLIVKTTENGCRPGQTVLLHMAQRGNEIILPQELPPI